MSTLILPAVTWYADFKSARENLFAKEATILASTIVAHSPTLAIVRIVFHAMQLAGICLSVVIFFTIDMVAVADKPHSFVSISGEAHLTESMKHKHLRCFSLNKHPRWETSIFTDSTW